MMRVRPAEFAAPETTLDWNLFLAATRYPHSPAVHFFGNSLTYRVLDSDVNRLAGWLQAVAGLKRGDRVALFMQNSPQWVIAFYAAIRIGGIIVPISPMNREAEVTHYVQDSGATVLIAAGELLPIASAVAAKSNIKSILVVSYSDYLGDAPDQPVPDWIAAVHDTPAGMTSWRTALSAGITPAAIDVGPEDLCALPYTSGSTGKPKACMHTHRSLTHTAAGMTYWHGILPGDVSLGVAPMYHVSGLCHAVTSPVFAGAAVAIVPRWDRVTVINVIERHRVTHASLPPTAIIDLLAAPELEGRDLASLRRMSSGGAAMPEAVWHQLRDRLGISFLEAYGMTETAATTHLNPPEAPRTRCLGIPFFGTQARIIDPETQKPVATGNIGEIVLRGPQLFQGYWNREDATRESFIDIDGVSYFRSGDIGYVDNDGYFYMTDRAKRMINASGLKVWPTEVESVLYSHPAVLEACVIGAPDSYRGETVKALLVLRAEHEGSVSPADMTAWCRERMAAYKYPRIVEFVRSLPKSPAGKILWRELQDKEMKSRQGDPYAS